MLTRRTLLGNSLAAMAVAIPERLVALTMDDPVKSHRTLRGPVAKGPRISRDLFRHSQLDAGH
jgi:hypothetical protein